MTHRQFIKEAGNETLPDVEVGVATFALRVAEVPEIAVVLSWAKVRVGSIVNRVRPGVGGLKLQTMSEALFEMGLQRVVARGSAGAEPVDAGVEYRRAAVHIADVNRPARSGREASIRSG